MTEPVTIPARPWQTATITEITVRTSRVKSFRMKPEQPFMFTAGQHAEVRLTAPDGYRAQRSYSISSPPEQMESFELTIERLDDGEVSPYFHDVAMVGDAVEVRGPLGGYFIWSVAAGGPLLLVGGGSGVAPLVSMVRHRMLSRALWVPIVLLFSARMWDEVIFREELFDYAAMNNGFQLVLAITREGARREGDYSRRIDGPIMSNALAMLPGPPSQVFVCGANAFCDTAATGAMMAGVPAGMIRTERYGV
ncbi:MAG: oxidoreductase [Devosia sp.]|uniref:FAD-binding oxidoreductase n=1 Tax=Devosia sp. TaxID=1871048 RepID=UPI0026127A1F|nr:FAD-binding oxidoreductase [Devosia sp.]MDB5542568.1 oxidoreductase [Devosia sp.]